MKFYINKTVNGSFESVIEQVTRSLTAEDFGVLTEIDVQKTFKEKLNTDFRKYKILGACNPPFAFEALGHEDKMGVLLPCNVVVQELGENEIEVAAVDPTVSMHMVENLGMDTLAQEVKDKLKRVIQSI
jgi:uncharacterized protein (DUF302 family)